MRTIFINPPTYSVDADLRLAISDEDDIEAFDRRMTRTATLDGNASVTDHGYSAADRTLDVTLPTITEAESEQLSSWLQSYSTLHAATPKGTYQVAPESYGYARGEGRLRLLILADRAET